MLPFRSLGQDFWQEIPWTTVGDSVATGKGNAVVTGKIILANANTTIPQASISVDTYKYFDYSDKNGSYALILPPGRYKVIVRHVGMKTRYLKMNVLASGTLDVIMEEGRLDLDEVVVTARPLDDNVKNPSAGLLTFSMNEMRTLPSLLGEVDVVKAIQLLPGVSNVGEGTIGFNVRGGRADQNLTLINGTPMFNISHAQGFVSSFSEEIIRDFNLFKGHVPAHYGGRSSSVLDINTRHGDLSKWNFTIGVGPISSRFVVDGPVVKGKSAVTASIRSAYPNWFLQSVDDPNVRSSKASFFDVYTSIYSKLSDNSVLDLMFYNSNDYFRFADQFAYQYQNNLMNARVSFLTDQKVSPDLTVAYGNYATAIIDPAGPDAAQIDNRIHYLQLKPRVVLNLNDKHQITTGVEAMGYYFDDEMRKGYNGNAAIAREEAQKDDGWELAIYGQYESEISKKLGLSLGLRYSTFLYIGPDEILRYEPGQPTTQAFVTDTTRFGGEVIQSYSGFEPRMSLRYNVFENHAIKLSYNRMYQYLHLISNTASATPVDVWQTSNRYLKPQVTESYSAGYFYNTPNVRWEMSTEVFYKDMNNLIEYRDFPDLFLNPHLETELLRGEGRAYGVEVYFRKIKGRWTGWLSYTYSQSEVKVDGGTASETINDGDWYPSNYNKPHVFNLVLERRFGKTGALSILAAYNTGRPFTAVESSYIVDGTVVPIYSERNKYTIPNYFRLDLSIKTNSLIGKLEDSLTLAIYNVLGRENAYSIFYQRPADAFFIPKPYKLSILGSALPSISYNVKL